MMVFALVAQPLYGALSAKLASAASAAVSQVVFTNPLQSVAPSAEASMGVQLRNVANGSESLDQPHTRLVLTSDSPTGLFADGESSNAWTSTTNYNYNNGWTNKSFRYKDPTPGTHTITAKVSGGGVPTEVVATQQVTITTPIPPTPVVTVPACIPGNSFDTFNLASVNGQGGWQSTGPFDQAVVENSYGFDGFGCKALRISNAVTSGSFGNQTFSFSTANEAGEVDATDPNNMSGGTRVGHFEAQFDLASTESTQQNGLSVSVSPDRGDGSRMSYLRFDDKTDGTHVYFDDVTSVSHPAIWNETDIATLSRTAPHTIKFAIDYVNGPSNDVVKIYIDNTLKHTGTSWENYYRYDHEAGAEQSPRTTDSLLFRVGGAAAPATQNKGYLIDNVSVTTSPNDAVAPTVPTGGQPHESFKATNDFYFEWNAATDDSGLPVTYEFQSSQSPSQSGGVLNSGVWHNSQGTPEQQNLTSPKIHSVGANGKWYWQVRAVDATGNKSAWSQIWNMTIDMVSPTIDLQQPQNGDRFKKDQQFTVSAHLTDNVGLANYRLLIDGIEPSHNDVSDQAQTFAAAGVGLDIHTVFNANDFTNGNHKITAWVVDKAGNESPKIERTIWIDKTAPTITVKSESVGSSDHFRTVSFKLFDNDKVVKYIINGVETKVTPNKWSDANGISAGKKGAKLGENTFTLVDAIGNTTTYVFWLDVVSPTASVTYSNNNGNTVTADDVTVTLTADEAIKTPDGWNKVDDVTFTKVHSENGKFSVVIEDLAGNQATIEYEVKRIDKIAPVINGVTNGETYGGAVTYSVTEQSIREIIVDGTSYGENNAPYTVSGEGAHTIKVVDKAGNEAEVQFIIDTTPPRLTLNTPKLNKNGTYTISGTTDDPTSEVEVRLDGAVLGNIDWDIDHTEWTVTTGVLAVGTTHTVTVSGTDGINAAIVMNTSFSVPPVPSTPLPTGITDGLSTPFPTPRALGVLPSTFNNPAAQDDTGVLGAQTKKDPTVDQNAKNTAIAATDEGWKLFGMLWYWWLLLGALVAAIAWSVTALARRRVAEDI